MKGTINKVWKEKPMTKHFLFIVSVLLLYLNLLAESFDYVIPSIGFFFVFLCWYMCYIIYNHLLPKESIIFFLKASEIKNQLYTLFIRFMLTSIPFTILCWMIFERYYDFYWTNTLTTILSFCYFLLTMGISDFQLYRKSKLLYDRNNPSLSPLNYSTYQKKVREEMRHILRELGAQNETESKLTSTKEIG